VRVRVNPISTSSSAGIAKGRPPESFERLQMFREFIEMAGTVPSGISFSGYPISSGQ
jgi:hypothetical protein